MHVFERHESEVRSYCRSFPAVFDRAEGSLLFDETGRRHVDFFSGAGALNYGHNNPRLKRALMDYLDRDGVVHTLDMASVAKRNFLTRFRQVILEPRGLDYKMQFPGPTGTNAVEAALKLARKVTGRHTVLSFTNSFHGMTLGALSVTGNAFKRGGAGVPLAHAAAMPFDGFLGPDVDTLEVLRAYLEGAGSGVDKPAAAIVETVQGEGGLNVARLEWLRGLAEILRQHGVLLIVDDVQVGCGRTGTFFSFEDAGLEPDMVCLSKSLSGYGLPMALVLIRPDIDLWNPGEHNGTFRGHNPAFVTATAALGYWEDGDRFSTEIRGKSELVRGRLESLAERHGATVRGRGLMLGLHFPEPGAAARVARRNFDLGLITETAGPDDSVLKLMPPLTADLAVLEEGLELLASGLHAAREAVLA